MKTEQDALYWLECAHKAAQVAHVLSVAANGMEDLSGDSIKSTRDAAFNAAMVAKGLMKRAEQEFDKAVG